MTIIPSDIQAAIQNASKVTGVNENLLTAFAQIESNFNTGAVSKTKVEGLFQIQKSTWKGVWKNEGQEERAYSYKAEDQALTAAHLIKQLAQQFNNNQNLIAIAYNAGPGVAKELIGKELNEPNVRNAVIKYFKPNAVDDKTGEVLGYAPRLAKALGQKFEIGSSSSGDEKAIVSSQPEETETADPNKEFFDSMTKKTVASIMSLNGVISKLDNGSDGTNGLLRAKLLAHPKLKELILGKEKRIALAWKASKLAEKKRA